MALTVKLQQKQAQSLVMTPQLAQSIKLLQFSHSELLDFVKDEIEKNPLLELAPEHGEPSPDRITSSDIDGIANGSLSETDGVLASTTALSDIAESQTEASLENVYDTGTAGAEKQALPASLPPSEGSAPSNMSASAGDEGFDLIANLGETPSLVSHLERQIAIEFKNAAEEKTAIAIAHSLNDDGYFLDNMENFAIRNKITVDELEWVLERFHGLEPVGIGARNLAECLELQLRDKNRFDPAMQKLLQNIDLLAKREFSKLLRFCGVEKEDFNEMIAEIRALDPRPARSYEPVLAEIVVPDVLINQTPLGDWNIELNPETLPKVLVDNAYQAQLSAALDDSEGQKFIADCMENANWLTRSLDQRAHTILKVAKEIVKSQDRFFAEGVQYLKPMTLKDVAKAIKMHESTISRVTSNKYLMCERGTFELKYFFSSAVSAGEDDDAVSAEAVKFHIQQMVGAESIENILSDEQIVTNLQEIGISIARRTVAKYREAMKISSSVQRRREKAAKL